MKKFIVVVCLIMFAGALAHSEKGVRETPSEKIVKYTGPSNMLVELSLQKGSGRITLRIKMGPEISDMGALEYLKQEATRLATGKIIVLNDNLSFEYLGGYKDWSPYLSYGPDGQYSCLMFTISGDIKNGVVYGKGRKTLPPYNGYREWNNKRKK